MTDGDKGHSGHGPVIGGWADDDDTLYQVWDTNVIDMEQETAGDCAVTRPSPEVRPIPNPE